MTSTNYAMLAKTAITVTLIAGEFENYIQKSLTFEIKLNSIFKNIE
jgi:hypothetical protein